MNPILLFDIDGTLLHIKRKFLYDVIDRILFEFEISHITVKNRSFAGRTDRDIFSELVGNGPDSDYLYKEVTAMYKKMMTENLSRFDVDIIPGASDTINYALEHNFELGLCTGNFREVALAKTDVIGFNNYFLFGGFGCQHSDRNYLPELARLDYQTRLDKTAKADQFIIIGDTPNDIRCAKHFGARSVAVATGGFEAGQLAEHSPDIILAGLHEPEDWIHTF